LDRRHGTKEKRHHSTAEFPGKVMAVQETLLEAYQLIRSAGAKLADRWPTLVALVLAGFTAKLLTLKVALLAGRCRGVGRARFPPLPRRFAGGDRADVPLDVPGAPQASLHHCASTVSC
jgi:hypothetical protein